MNEILSNTTDFPFICKLDKYIFQMRMPYSTPDIAFCQRFTCNTENNTTCFPCVSLAPSCLLSILKMH